MDIEVEIKCLLTREQYISLLAFFSANAQKLKEDEQETQYLDAGVDVRIQQNKENAKLILKGGKVHDEMRQEIEVNVARTDFPKLERIFSAIGLKPKVKWFRKRHAFQWGDISVAVDATKGYGYILELEQMATFSTQDAALKLLKEKAQELGVTITPREQFDKMFEHYVENWEVLVKEHK